jgi:Fungal specific transcription factor domain
LEALEKDDYQPDPEEIVRGGADIRMNKDDDDSKFLGPSSGIAITRLVMQLAKRFTQAESINEIVAPNQAEQVKVAFAEEEGKPTSKVYPIISNIAAPDLPPREMTTVLVKLFNLKGMPVLSISVNLANGTVMTMYPFMHEPTFWQDVEDVYSGSKDPFQNFAVRMVIAISLQRYDSQYAGLADSFYLAALAFLEDAVKPMNVRTIQCFCLIGGYSLLTPTRTAVYYVIGLATRLCQALGLAEEKTILQGPNGQRANPLEIDMRRRLFWSVINMDFGLAHSMGRASSFATALEHIDVQWFELVDDEYLTTEGVTPNAPTSLRKWICIHFIKMRLLQLEIRRMLYQRKRPQPLNDSHPWFAAMDKKLEEWRVATPTTDAGTGLDKAWYVRQIFWAN